MNKMRITLPTERIVERHEWETLENYVYQENISK